MSSHNMASRVARYLEPVTLVGIVISAALIVVLPIINATDFAHSTEISLLGVLISLQYDSLVRSERRHGLSSLLQSPPWLFPAAKSIGESTKDMLKLEHNDLILRMAQSSIKQCSEEFDKLRHGRFQERADNYDRLVGLIEAAKESVLAVTNIYANPDGLDWWHREVGQNYWRANQEALRRGVAISRIFIYREWSDTLEQLAQDQVRAGVKTYKAQYSRMEADLRINFAVFDMSATWRAEMNAQGEIMRNLFSVSMEDTSELRRTFERIRAHSEIVE